MQKFSCAFTGHRPHKFSWGYDENAEGCIKLKQLLTAQIAALVNYGTVEFLSGMAEGTDTWAIMLMFCWLFITASGGVERQRLYATHKKTAQVLSP